LILYPAIDLLDGRVVRLERGRREAATVYPLAPRDAVRRFAAAGARWLHVVDLNRAFGDGGSNLETLRSIVEEASRHRMRVQTGGGLRAAGDLEEAFRCGAARVVVGTTAAVDVERAAALIETYGARLAIGLDAKDGEVVVRGWTEGAGRTVSDLGGELARRGARRFVYTDVARDGMMAGPDIDGAAALARATGVPVIASGGVGEVAHVAAARAARVDGLILGKAIYDGRLDAAAAVEAAGLQELA
jgi:phosphoribosylformimino-5-aminoimidazole carboxamide ribotide isomerase